MTGFAGNPMILTQSNEKKELFAVGSYFVFWGIQMLCKGFGLENGGAYKLLSLLSLLFLGIKLLLTEWTFRDLTLSCCIVFLGFMTWLMSDMLPMLLLALAIVGAKGVPIKKLLYVTFYIRGVSFLIVVSGSFFGLFPENGSQYREIFDLFSFVFQGEERAVVLRRFLGFSTANLASVHLLIILSLFIYVNDNKLGVVHYLLMILVNAILYRFTGSRTSMALVYFLIALSAAMRFRALRRPIYAAGVWAFFGIFLFSVLSALLFAQSDQPQTAWENICQKLDLLLSGRLGYNAYAIRTFSVLLYGGKFQNNWSQLDNAYLNLWLRFGFVNCALFLLVCTSHLRECKRLRRHASFLIFVVFAVLGYMEMSMYAITMNVFLLELSSFLFPQSGRKYPKEAVFKKMRLRK